MEEARGRRPRHGSSSHTHLARASVTSLTERRDKGSTWLGALYAAAEPRRDCRDWAPAGDLIPPLHLRQPRLRSPVSLTISLYLSLYLSLSISLYLSLSLRDVVQPPIFVTAALKRKKKLALT